MVDETNGEDVFRTYRVAPDDIFQFKNLSPAKGMPVIPPDNATFNVNWKVD